MVELTQDEAEALAERFEVDILLEAGELELLETPANPALLSALRKLWEATR